MASKDSSERDDSFVSRAAAESSLQASNEELQAMNEELRVTTEELEASQRELESLNEQLMTVNEELEAKVRELMHANNDARNLMNATEIATLFLDAEGRIRLYTPRMRALFNLIPDDVGRPIEHITHRLRYPQLEANIASVAETLQTIEREVESANGGAYIARLMPYRTSDDRIDGVVLTFVDITARRRAEAAVRASEEQFRRAIEEAPVPVIMHAEDGEVLQISRTWTELTGYALRDVPTVDAWLTRAYGEGADAVRAHMHDLFAGSRRSLDVEFEIATQSGEHRRWSFSASSPGTLLDGRRFIVGMAVDITERSRADAALRDSEERYRTLFDSIDEGFCILDLIRDGAGKVLDYRFREVNAAFAKQSGIANAAGRLMREVAPGHEEEWFQIYGEVAATGEPVRFEGRAAALDRWFDVYASRIGGRGSDRVAVVFTDITARRAAEEALRRSEERLRLTVESVPDYAIFTTDTSGRIESWNAGAENIFGYAETEAIGQNASILFTPEDRARNAHLLEMQMAREQGRALDERWHMRRDGSRFYASGVLAPLLDGMRLLGYTKIAQDLTERRRAEESLREAREQLEVRWAERTRDLAETNEALRCEIIERKQSEEMRVRLLGRLVQAQEGECRRISRELHDQLGQQLTALGLKIAAMGEAPLLPAPLQRELADLASIWKQLEQDVDFIVWELRPTALDDLGLVDALSEYIGTWQRHFDVAVHLTTQGMDRIRLEPHIETTLYRIAQEALNNVAKHARAHEVGLLLERRADLVSLIVEDDGRGFDPAAGEAGIGTGLGITGMRERAALAGGTLSIESQPGGARQFLYGFLAPHSRWNHEQAARTVGRRPRHSA
ncbi:MAG TPA: PAS domain S-box protein [Burkholderiales bacterium]|nr:PAS domain S-box protein [Burkholderiales bacterium]